MDITYPTINDNEALKTAQAGTPEWLKASKDMLIASYTGTRSNQRVVLGLPLGYEEEGSLFGTHLREAADVLRKLLGR